MRLNLNFKRIGVWGRVLGGGVLLAVLGAAAGEALESVRAVKTVMQDMNRQYNRVEEGFRRGELAGLGEPILAMEGFFGEIRPAYRPFYGVSRESWERQCDRSLAVLAEMKAAYDAGDLEKARTGCLALAQIREESHSLFRPGFFTRIKRLFAKT